MAWKVCGSIFARSSGCRGGLGRGGLRRVHGMHDAQCTMQKEERDARAAGNNTRRRHHEVPPDGAGKLRTLTYNPIPMQKGEARHRDTAARRLCLLVGLAGAIAFVYAPVLGFDFVSWDDPWYVSNNPHVLGGLSWSAAWWAFTTGGDFYWHPLTWLSHQLDVTLFGVNPGWHHATNVLLHGANTLLLFALLKGSGLFAPITKPNATGESGAFTPDLLAFVAAALFALHPLRVESVAWVAERKDVLSGLFWMLTIAAYFHYARKPGWRRYALVVAAFGLGLMAKPMIVTLPVVLLLLDVWPLRRWTHVGPQASGLWPQTSRASLLAEKLPLLLLGAAVAVATLFVQAKVGAVGGTVAAVPRVPPLERARFLRGLPREDVLAGQPGGLLSLPGGAAGAVAGRLLCRRRRRHARRGLQAGGNAALRHDRRALVPRHAAAGLGPVPGRRSADGGPVHVSAVDWHRAVSRVGRRRPRGSRQAETRRAPALDPVRCGRHRGSCRLAGLRCRLPRAGGALEKQRDALDPRARRDERQSPRPRRAGRVAGRTRTGGRGDRELPGGRPARTGRRRLPPRAGDDSGEAGTIGGRRCANSRWPSASTRGT